MSSSFQEIIARQGGIFVRRQAIAAGCSPKEFLWLTRGQHATWIRIRYGVYTSRVKWEATQPRERALLLDRAALLVCDEGTVLSHSSAARHHGLPLYNADDGLSHVTRVRIHDRRLTRSVSGIKHHCGCLTQDEIATVQGIPVTSVARTVLDMASEFGYRSGLVVADAALARLVTAEQLRDSLGGFVHDAKARIRAAVVADADGRAQTPIESLARILLTNMGISDVQPQFAVQLANGVTTHVDLYSPSLHHCFECDGRLKYRTQVNLIGVQVSAEDVVWEEKQREDALRALGLGVSRLVWKDTMADAFNRVSARVWQEIRSQDAAGRRQWRDRAG